MNLTEEKKEQEKPLEKKYFENALPRRFTKSCFEKPLNGFFFKFLKSFHIVCLNNFFSFFKIELIKICAVLNLTRGEILMVFPWNVTYV